MDRAYVATRDEVLRFFGVDEKTGFDEAQVVAARAKYGRNGEWCPMHFRACMIGGRAGCTLASFCVMSGPARWTQALMA